MLATLWYVWLLLSVHAVANIIVSMPPSMTNEAYSQDGDLIIGAIYSATGRSNDINNPCGGPLTSVRLQENIEAVAYYINLFNKDPSILPNITIGYKILDDCRRGSTALAKSTQFISSTEEKCPNSVRQEDTSVNDVVGVIGATSSERAFGVSQLMGMYRIPMISPEATSDQLSDPFEHAYFFRLVPPDMIMARAMINLLVRHDWWYISLLYKRGTYGATFAENIKSEANKAGVCIGYIHEFTNNLDEAHFDFVVKNLKDNDRARVVILILDVDHAPRFFSAVERAGLVGHFQWIGGDTLDERAFSGYEDVALGSITFTFPLERVEEFADHMYQVNPWNTPANPWLKPLWSNIFQCSWVNDSTCYNHIAIGEADEYYFSEWTSRTIDSIKAMLMALDEHVKEDCSEYIGNSVLLRCCVRGSKIREKLLNMAFNGSTGPVKFDDQGNLLGDYIINQFIKTNGEYKVQNLGRWVGSEDQVDLYNNTIWYVHTNDDILKSICSDPCDKGYIYIQKELPCCWECLKCRENEIMDENATVCTHCPIFFWPNQENFLVCEPIVPTYIRSSDAYGITLSIIPTAGIIITIACSVVFALNWNKRIIKASNRYIMVFLFIGIYLSFCSALVFVIKPDTVACSLGHVGFHLSCTLLYGPLCVKTTRIHRIIYASKKFRQPKGLTTETSQIGLTIWIILSQAVIILGSVILGNALEQYYLGWHLIVPSEARLQMPIAIEPLVELVCERPRIKLLLPLSVNMVLLIWCSVLAFKTRHLPEAYNEAWYIFLSVSATLVIWGAFIPAYFLMFYAYYRETLLSLCVSLSAICNLALLFFPKVYAVYCVDEDRISTSFSMINFGEQSRVSKRTISTSTLPEPEIYTLSDEKRTRTATC